MEAASEQHGEQHDPEDNEPVWTYVIRHRIRVTCEEAHAVLMSRLRDAKRQGGAASDSGLAAEIRELAKAKQFARTQHGPARDVAHGHIRRAYLAIAASAMILAERATRPAEAPKRGERGGRKGEGVHRRPCFTVPPVAPA